MATKGWVENKRVVAPPLDDVCRGRSSLSNWVDKVEVVDRRGRLVYVRTTRSRCRPLLRDSRIVTGIWMYARPLLDIRRFSGSNTGGYRWRDAGHDWSSARYANAEGKILNERGNEGLWLPRNEGLLGDTDFANKISVRNWMYDMSKEFTDTSIWVKQKQSK